MMSGEVSFPCWFSNRKLVWLIIGFIFSSIIFVQYYFEIPCANRNRNHPLSSYCLIFPSSMATTTTKFGKDREFQNVTNRFSTSSVPEGKIVNNSSSSRRWQGPSASAPPPPPPTYEQDSSPGINVIKENNFTQTSPENGTTPPPTRSIPSPPPTEAVAECNNNGINIPADKKGGDSAGGKVLSIATMNNILLQSYASPVPNSVCISGGDRELVEARLEIEKAPVLFSSTSEGLYAPIYWNISRFKRSYELMEKTLKVYIYREGNRPVFHQPNLKGIYASEGWFMKQMEANKQYVTNNPNKAHLFYFPFSSQMLEQTVYIPNSHTFDRLKQYLENYLDIIKTKYSFWNRTSGADHFLVSCHDWAPEETRRLMANCIRALCNADIKEGFQLGKDVSLPETLMPPVRFSSKEKNLPSQRKFLAFFAGNMHGYLRPILLKHWSQNKDPDMMIFGRMHKTNYVNHMKNSKYCICARGYEVNSPRLVESIMYGCIPVIISDNFVPPFLEVLNWEKIAVFVPEKDIPELKNILVSISERRYRVMQHRVKMVRRHFLWHPGVPEKYDIFHMILHSVWYNRVFRITHH